MIVLSGDSVPYGLPRSQGGDTPEKDAKMERCIADLQAKGYPKLKALLICKASIDHTIKR